MSTRRYLNGASVPDAVAAGQKAAGMANAQQSITYGQSRLAKANQLIADLPAMQRELQSLEKISSVAEKLHKTTALEFRFFMVVSGHEVNLAVSRGLMR